MSRDNSFDEVTKQAISKIIENLGPNVTKTRYEISKSTNHYANTFLDYLCVTFKNKTNNQSEELSLILKKIKSNSLVKKYHCDKSQFHNEILFYQMYVGPDNDNFPKCFYANQQPPTDSVIVLENIVKRGYCICPYMFDASLEYTLAAMREIGRFHGRGYAMKEKQRQKFFDIVKRIKDTKFITKKENWVKFFSFVMTRAVKYLRDHGHDAVFCDRMEAFLSNTYYNVIMKAVEPLEPLSTLCHGDFTLSNVLFKSQNDGQYRAMLIDFADIRYATPAIDLTTYLCMCCPNELKKDKFFDILKVYYNALGEYLLEAGVENIERYSYDALLNDFKKGSLFGFAIASYFSAVLRGYRINIELNGDIDVAEWGKVINQCGGDEVSKILADTLLNLKDIGCLEHIL